MGGGVPAKEAVSAGSESAEEALSTGDGLVGDIGPDEDSPAVVEALYPPIGLAGDDPADCVGGIDSGDGGACAERIDGMDLGEKEDDNKKSGEDGGGGGGGGGGA